MQDTPFQVGVRLDTIAGLQPEPDVMTTLVSRMRLICSDYTLSIKAGLFMLAFNGAVVLAAEYATPGIESINLLEKLNTDQAPLVVDVRKPAEYAVAHIPGAINIPLSEVADRVGEFRHDNGVVVYCINGSRTRKAEAILLDAKIPDLYHLEGTFTAWIRDKHPYEKGGVEKKGW